MPTCDACDYGKFDRGDRCEFWGFSCTTGDEWLCTHPRYGERDGCPLDWGDEEEEDE